MNNKNANKPGYKHTPLGWIPEDWKICNLSNLTVKVGSGITPTGGEKTYKSSGRHFLRSQNVGWGQLLLDDVAFIDEETHSRFPQTELKQQDVLLNITGASIGRSAVADERVAGGNVNQHVCIIRTKQSELFPTYLNSFLLSTKGQNLINSYQAGGNRQGLNFEQIRSFSIPLPPFPEQRKIAAILSTWDEAIKKTQKLIEQLQERNKGLMQQLLKPKASWKEYRVGDLLKQVKRPVEWNDNELYHLISVRRRSGGTFYRESLYGRQILTKQLFTTEEGDFLISKMQIVHGASSIVPIELAGMKISGSYIAVHAKNDKKLSIQFFNWLSKTPWFYRLTYISSYGVHIEKMTFDYNDFTRHKIKIPSTLKEQGEIIEILQKSVEEIKQYELYLATLQQQKKGLMQQLLTGSVRVKVEEGKKKE